MPYFVSYQSNIRVGFGIKEMNYLVIIAKTDTSYKINVDMPICFMRVFFPLRVKRYKTFESSCTSFVKTMLSLIWLRGVKKLLTFYFEDFCVCLRQVGSGVGGDKTMVKNLLTKVINLQTNKKSNNKLLQESFNMLRWK